jgi:hypothetical protein
MYDGIFPAESIEDVTLTDSDWVIPGLIPTEGITILDGKPKSGKSTLALGIAMSVARGTPFADDQRFSAGCLVGEPSPVLYVGTDGRWKQELVKRKDYYPPENRGNLHLLDGRKAGLIFPAGHDQPLEDSKWRWRQFTEWSKSQGYRIVILDHLLKLAGGRSINTDSDMSPVIGVLDDLVLAGIVPLLLHHQSVHGTNGSAMGHTVIHASMRSGLSIREGARGADAQSVRVVTNENPTMTLVIGALRGRPPVVLDFVEEADKPRREKRQRTPKSNIAVNRAKAILEGPPEARVNQVEAGKFLGTLGVDIMGTATDGRSVIRGLLDKGLLATGHDRRIVPGPKWAA